MVGDRCHAQASRGGLQLPLPPPPGRCGSAGREGERSSQPLLASAASVWGGGRPSSPATSLSLGTGPERGSRLPWRRGELRGGAGCGRECRTGGRQEGGSPRQPLAAAPPLPSPCVTTFRARHGGDRLCGRLPPKWSRSPGGVCGGGAAPGARRWPPAA